MSFILQSHTISQRKNLKLKGTKTSVAKNQILISTGIVSLDAVLGKSIKFQCYFFIFIYIYYINLNISDGGIPIGTVTLVGKDIM
jgi:hypothetical protein